MSLAPHWSQVGLALAPPLQCSQSILSQKEQWYQA
jgi:hypothetical protein